MRFTRPWYGVVTRIITIPVCITLLLMQSLCACVYDFFENASEFFHDAYEALDRSLP